LPVEKPLLKFLKGVENDNNSFHKTLINRIACAKSNKSSRLRRSRRLEDGWRMVEKDVGRWIRALL